MDKEELDKLVEKAKTKAKKRYEDYMKKIDCFNPKYKRTWREVKRPDGSVIWALSGTPDKCFVLITPDYKVMEVNLSGEILEEFN